MEVMGGLGKTILHVALISAKWSRTGIATVVEGESRTIRSLHDNCQTARRIEFKPHL